MGGPCRGRCEGSGGLPPGVEVVHYHGHGGRPPADPATGHRPARRLLRPVGPLPAMHDLPDVGRKVLSVLRQSPPAQDQGGQGASLGAAQGDQGGGGRQRRRSRSDRADRRAGQEGGGLPDHADQGL